MVSTLTGSGEFGSFKKKQDFIYTSPAAGFHEGKRSDPIAALTHWTPAPSTYDVRRDANQNDAPKMK